MFFLCFGWRGEVEPVVIRSVRADMETLCTGTAKGAELPVKGSKKKRDERDFFWEKDLLVEVSSIAVL